MAVFLGKLTIYLYFCAINIKTEQSRMVNFMNYDNNGYEWI